MSSKEQPKSDDSKEESSFWKLDTIPPELFLHICSFLSAKIVINVLSLVCQQFKEIIQNDSTWRMRIHNRWGKRYPIIPPNENFNWKEACIAREEQYNLWHNVALNMKMYNIKDAHYAAVNVVLMLEDGRFCASGARDRCLKLWDFHILKEQEPSSSGNDYRMCLVNSSDTAHAGWIWSMAYDKFNRRLYTGGFDNVIKTWEVDNPANEMATYCLSSPILCLAFSGNTLASGCYGRIVRLLDPRASQQPVIQHVHHKKPVLCIVGDEKFIISGSEDGSIIVYDKVAGKVQNSIELEGFPLSMSYDEGYLLVGDVHGSLHVIDPTNEKFDLVKSYKSGHETKITGIQHSLGSIITCSTDKTIRVLEPSVDPAAIAVLPCGSEVSRISSNGSTLASANTDDSISVWFPNEE